MDYPDEDDEFELMYGEELEVLKEIEDDDPVDSPVKSKRSLKFQSPVGHSKTDLGVVDNLEHSFTSKDSSSSQRPKRLAEDDPTGAATPTKVRPTKIARIDAQSDSPPLLDADVEKGSCELSCVSFFKKGNPISRHTRRMLEDAEEENAALMQPQIRVWKRIPPGNFIPVTSEQDQRVYLRLRNAQYFEEESYKFSSQKTCRLLAVPYEILRHEAELEREKCLLRMSEQEASTGGEMIQGDGTGTGANQLPKGDMDLWVEKYKPQHYVELLSDDGTNRMLLHWLKLWDKVVFGRNIKRRPAVKKEVSKVWTPNFPKKPDTSEVGEELDSNGCPIQKIVLLCGPPGLGKTTLAHVIAKHAGYNVIELNASDDRSPELFRTRIEAATQMKSVLGHDPRPNCLIIDEIDGAPAAAINVLISMAAGKATAAKEKGPMKKKKASSTGFLQRPIICICNDIYVPALRLLRQNAFVLTFPPTLGCRLATRLGYILRKQRHDVDAAVLLLLCEKAENDIRSCLSTLQFIFTRNASVRRFDVQNASIGQKDVQKGLFNVWQNIFHLPRPKRKLIGPLAHSDEKDTTTEQNKQIDVNDQSERARCHRVLRSVQSCGEYDKLFQGIFDNYLHMKIKDTQFKTVAIGAEWLQFMDLVNTQIFHNQSYVLMPYLPYSAVAFHMLFAATVIPKINFPSSHFEFTTKLNLILNHLASLRADMAPAPRAFSNSVSMVTDLLPHLVTITQPSLRPVNTHLYSIREKEELARLINIMIAYNLTYVQQRSMEGQYSYVLEPNAEEVVSFSGLKPRLPMSYAAKQLVAREIELEKMRRAERPQETSAASDASRLETAVTEEKAKFADAPVLPNHRRTLEPKAIAEVDKPTLDFFGRVVKVPVRPDNETSSSSSGSAGGVWFHFKEGFSNAVRRPIRVGDLL